MRKSWMFLILGAGIALPCAAEDLFVSKPVYDTPYGSYLSAVRSIVARTEPRGELSMDAVEKWTRQASRIRYEHAGEYSWKTPEQVEADGTGDCKDKALWLFSRLRAAGATSLEMVLGKRELASATCHAWVTLRFGGKTYILDPTESGAVWESADFGRGEYIPFYSFDGFRSYAYELRR